TIQQRSSRFVLVILNQLLRLGDLIARVLEVQRRLRVIRRTTDLGGAHGRLRRSQLVLWNSSTAARTRGERGEHRYNRNPLSSEHLDPPAGEELYTRARESTGLASRVLVR